jgi:hypothetical protein
VGVSAQCHQHSDDDRPPSESLGRKSDSEYEPSEVAVPPNPTSNPSSEHEPDEPEPNDDDLEIRRAKAREIQAYRRFISLPTRWVNAFNEMENLLPKVWLDWSNISPYLQHSWWHTRNDPEMSCIFIDFQFIMDIKHKALLSHRAPARSFTTATGDLYNLYGSVANRIERHRVVFLMARASTEDGTPNHFFAVLFDYDYCRVGIYGNEVGTAPRRYALSGGSQSWAKEWAGPWLWEVIGRQLGWIGEGEEVSLDVVSLMYNNWPQVCSNVFFLTIIIGLTMYLNRTGMTVGRMHPLSFSKHFKERNSLELPPSILRRNSADTRHG